MSVSKSKHRVILTVRCKERHKVNRSNTTWLWYTRLQRSTIRNESIQVNQKISTTHVRTEEAKVVFKVPLILRRFFIGITIQIAKDSPDRDHGGSSPQLVSIAAACHQFPAAHTHCFPRPIPSRTRSEPDCGKPQQLSFWCSLSLSLVLGQRSVCCVCDTIMHTSHKMMRSSLSNVALVYTNNKEDVPNSDTFLSTSTSSRYETHN